MGHGKNKQQKGSGKAGIGTAAAPKETKEQKRQRLADEAKAREQCFKALPYVIGFVVFLILAFALWVHSLPPPPPPKVVDPLKKMMPNLGGGSGLTFEQALAAQTNSESKQNLQKLFDEVNADLKEKKMAAESEGEEEPENVMNLDAEEL